MKKLLLALPLISIAATTYAEQTGNIAVEFVDTFESTFGVTQGKRRNHTKGFCFSGQLVPTDPTMKSYSISSLFTDHSQVIGRLSHKGGNNKAADNKKGEYGMALSIQTVTGEEHRLSMNTLDFLPVSTPKAFLELMKAKQQGKEALVAFKKKYPEIKQFKAHHSKRDQTVKPYEAMQFNSINSFYLVNDSAQKTAIRWSFRPAIEQKTVVTPNQGFFWNNIRENLKNNGVVWDMVITIANSDDDIDNGAKQWQGEHQEIIAAKLKLTAVSTEQDGQCDSINYDPLVLSKGFEPSNDPLLVARRHSYAVSFGRRISEKAE